MYGLYYNRTLGSGYFMAFYFNYIVQCFNYINAMKSFKTFTCKLQTLKKNDNGRNHNIIKGHNTMNFCPYSVHASNIYFLC